MAYRSFIFLTRLPPRFLRLCSMGLGRGFTNFTGGGSCNKNKKIVINLLRFQCYIILCRAKWHSDARPARSMSSRMSTNGYGFSHSRTERRDAKWRGTVDYGTFVGWLCAKIWQFDRGIDTHNQFFTVYHAFWHEGLTMSVQHKESTIHVPLQNLRRKAPQWTALQRVTLLFIHWYGDGSLSSVSTPPLCGALL